ncbi:transposase [Lysobacter sp. FW306-1B-D06B]|uniref:transposase n=1 Tax=Lysobacter sp. FW306-1B-D06B TaxID=3140250 RepID=UPI0031400DA6
MHPEAFLLTGGELVTDALSGQLALELLHDGVPAPQTAANVAGVLGIDLGLTDTAALSTGEVIVAPKHLAVKLAKLRRCQRSFSRQRDAAARRQGLDRASRCPRARASKRRSACIVASAR